MQSLGESIQSQLTHAGACLCLEMWSVFALCRTLLLWERWKRLDIFCPLGISDILNKEPMFVWAGRPARGLRASHRLHAITDFKGLSAFEVEEIDQWSTHFSCRRHCENTQSTIWANKCFIYLVVIIFGIGSGAVQTGVPEEAANQAKGWKKDRDYLSIHFFVWVWF